jgi:hypothetical protein
MNDEARRDLEPTPLQLRSPPTELAACLERVSRGYNRRGTTPHDDHIDASGTDMVDDDLPLRARAVELLGMIATHNEHFGASRFEAHRLFSGVFEKPVQYQDDPNRTLTSTPHTGT